MSEDIDVIDERGQRKQPLRSFEDLLGMFARGCAEHALGHRSQASLETIWSALIRKHLSEMNMQYELGVMDGKEMAND